MVLIEEGSRFNLIRPIHEAKRLEICPIESQTFTGSNGLMAVPRMLRFVKWVPKFTRPQCRHHVSVYKIVQDAQPVQILDDIRLTCGFAKDFWPQIAFNEADVIDFVRAYSKWPNNHLCEGESRTLFPLMTQHNEPMMGVVTMDSNGRKSIDFIHIHIDHTVWEADKQHCIVLPEIEFELA